MPETASSLNSGDSFVLLTTSDVYIWVGNGCAADEAAVAETISQVMRAKMVLERVVAEGLGGVRAVEPYCPYLRERNVSLRQTH